MSVYLPLLTSLVTIVSMFAIMWQLSPPLALFAVALTVPLGLIIRHFAGSMTDRKYQEWELQGEISSLVEQTLTAIPVVQAFGREPREDARFRDVANRTIQASYRSEAAQHQFRVVTGIITAAATAIVIAVGGWAVLAGTLSVGSLLVLMAYYTALYSPIETLVYLSEGFASARAGARRILEITESDEHGAKDLPGALTLPEAFREAGISVRREQRKIHAHDQLADAARIGSDTPHQIAGRLPLMKQNRALLQVFKDVGGQIVYHAAAGARFKVILHDGHDPAGEKRHDGSRG
jgi:ABC-type multidrug transport system fused ATPase/permease subunit